MDEGEAGLRGAKNPFPPLAAGDAQQSLERAVLV